MQKNTWEKKKYKKHNSLRSTVKEEKTVLWGLLCLWRLRVQPPRTKGK